MSQDVLRTGEGGKTCLGDEDALPIHLAHSSTQIVHPAVTATGEGCRDRQGALSQGVGLGGWHGGQLTLAPEPPRWLYALSSWPSAGLSGRRDSRGLGDLSAATKPA